MASRQIGETILLSLAYSDDTPYGSMISGRMEATLCDRAARVLDRVPRPFSHGDLWAALAAPEGFGDCYDTATRLKPDLLYPDPALVVPTALSVSDAATERRATVALPPGLVPELAAWISEWQVAAQPPRTGPARALFDRLEAAGAFTPVTAEAPVPDAPLTFVGHATVLVNSGRTRILVDPFLLPGDPAHARGYRPMPQTRWPVDAILITHSHPDHFHPGTLLRFAPDTRILVPEVARESALSIAMAARLRELGFRRVETLGWHAQTMIGDCRVTALPFHGEQPSAAEVLHPEVRNAGNLYLVEAGGRRYAFAADAGRDALGDTRAVAQAACLTHGPANVVFCGYRNWAVYPAQLVGSSVTRYALFVPPSLRSVRQSLMNGPDEALDVAECWGARHLVGYADGGAPWYWRQGLGPVLDGSAPAGDPHTDPLPETLVAAAARRSTWQDEPVPSPVSVLTLRPGDGLRLDGSVPAIERRPDHAWPYAAGVATSGEELLLARKKVLLRILAPYALDALGLAVAPEAAQRLADQLRTLYGLERADSMRAWLSEHGLADTAFAELMWDWARGLALESHFAAEIERRLPTQLALQAMPAEVQP
ncbi:MBL fold metallo-hydrolase [Azospirillum sp. sgz301742]